MATNQLKRTTNPSQYTRIPCHANGPDLKNAARTATRKVRATQK
jgi:hypothetical protein